MACALSTAKRKEVVTEGKKLAVRTALGPRTRWQKRRI